MIGRGEFGGRGGYGRGGRDNSKYHPSNVLVTPQHPLTDEVTDLLQEMRIDIMREVQTIITNAVTLYVTHQIKVAITEGLSPRATEILTLTPNEPFDDTDLITQ